MNYFLISFLVFSFIPANSQVTGRILDASTDEPVKGAMIISGTAKSYSEVDGTFSISVSGMIIVYADGYQILNLKSDTLKSLIIRLEPLNYLLSEVSITAYNTPEKLRNVAGAVSVVPVGRTEKSGYNIVSAISSSPGVFIQEATPGTMKLSLRGIGSRYPYGTKKIKMYFDGIPLYSAEGETYFDEISPEYLGRIEILRGPASSIYGASLGGAVIMYPQRSEYGRSELSLMNSAGSYGWTRNTLNYSNAKERDDMLISFSRIKSDGYRENSSYLRNSFLINHNHPFGEKVKSSILLTGSLVNSRIPSSIDSLSFTSNPKAAAPQWLQTHGNKKPERIMAGYKIKYRPSDSWDIMSSVFGTLRKNEENRPFNFLNETGISYGGRLLTRFIRNSGGLNYIITSGSNLFFEIYNNSISENNGGMGVKGNLMQKGSQYIYQADLFSQLEIEVSEITFTSGFDLNRSGFRFKDQFSYDTVNQSGSYDFNTVFSPRFSISWNYNNTINTYIAINHGFTLPSLSETQTPIGLINRDIKPEKAWSYETGVRLDLFSNRTFLDVALYYMRVSDLIVPKRVEDDFYVGMNAGASLHRGIELSIQQWLWGNQKSNKDESSSIFMELSYSVNRFNFLEFTEGENNFSGNQLPGIPENFFNGSINLNKTSGIISKIEVLSSGKIPLDDFNSRFSDSWIVLNATAGYLIPIKMKWGIEAMLALNNITNASYASMVVVNAPGTATRPPRYFYPGMPRWFSFNLGLRYRFEME